MSERNKLFSRIMTACAIVMLGFSALLLGSMILSRAADDNVKTTITLDPSGTQSFGLSNPRKVTITNSGAYQTGEITITIDGTSFHTSTTQNGNFNASSKKLNSIQPSETGSFWVYCTASGTHTHSAKITIEGTYFVSGNVILNCGSTPSSGGGDVEYEYRCKCGCGGNIGDHDDPPPNKLDTVWLLALFCILAIFVLMVLVLRKPRQSLPKAKLSRGKGESHLDYGATYSQSGAPYPPQPYPYPSQPQSANPTIQHASAPYNRQVSSSATNTSPVHQTAPTQQRQSQPSSSGQPYTPNQ